MPRDVTRFPPVGQPQGEQLQTGGLEEEVPVLGGQLRDAGDAVAEGADDVNGGGEEVVELRDLGRLVLHEPGLGLHLLLWYLDVLKLWQAVNTFLDIVALKIYAFGCQCYDHTSVVSDATAEISGVVRVLSFCSEDIDRTMVTASTGVQPTAAQSWSMKMWPFSFPLLLADNQFFGTQPPRQQSAGTICVKIWKYLICGLYWFLSRPRRRIRATWIILPWHLRRRLQPPRSSRHITTAAAEPTCSDTQHRDTTLCWHVGLGSNLKCFNLSAGLAIFRIDFAVHCPLFPIL